MMDYNGMSQHKKLIQFIDGCERIWQLDEGGDDADTVRLTAKFPITDMPCHLVRLKAHKCGRKSFIWDSCRLMRTRSGEPTFQIITTNSIVRKQRQKQSKKYSNTQYSGGIKCNYNDEINTVQSVFNEEHISWVPSHTLRWPVKSNSPTLFCIFCLKKLEFKRGFSASSLFDRNVFRYFMRCSRGWRGRTHDILCGFAVFCVQLLVFKTQIHNIL